MGGNTALSGGMIQAAGHRLQKELADCSDEMCIRDRRVVDLDKLREIAYLERE